VPDFPPTFVDIGEGLLLSTENSVAWAPDGSRFAHGRNGVGLFTSRADGSRTVTLTKRLSINQQAMSPDGKVLAIRGEIAHQPGRLWLSSSSAEYLQRIRFRGSWEDIAYPGWLNAKTLVVSVNKSDEVTTFGLLDLTQERPRVKT